MSVANMNELQTILGNIRTSLGNVKFPALNSSSARGTAYEVYNFALTLDAAERAGADKPRLLCGNKNLAIPPYKFRLAGSRISATNDYTYAELTFSKAMKRKLPLEVHVGIYLCGPSCERVQSDVCVLLQAEADYFRVRQSRRRSKKSPYSWPDARNVLLTTECKFYTNDLSSKVIHEVIGRLKELPAANRLVVVNTLSDAAGNRVKGSFNNDSSTWCGNATPLNPAGVQRLQYLLCNVFYSYIEDLSHIDN